MGIYARTILIALMMFNLVAADLSSATGSKPCYCCKSSAGSSADMDGASVKLPPMSCCKVADGARPAAMAANAAFGDFGGQHHVPAPHTRSGPASRPNYTDNSSLKAPTPYESPPIYTLTSNYLC